MHGVWEAQGYYTLVRFRVWILALHPSSRVGCASGVATRFKMTVRRCSSPLLVQYDAGAGVPGAMDGVVAGDEEFGDASLRRAKAERALIDPKAIERERSAIEGVGAGNATSDIDCRNIKCGRECTAPHTGPNADESAAGRSGIGAELWEWPGADSRKGKTVPV